jgi:hypothetical protein
VSKPIPHFGSVFPGFPQCPRGLIGEKTSTTNPVPTSSGTPRHPREALRSPRYGSRRCTDVSRRLDQPSSHRPIQSSKLSTVVIGKLIGGRHHFQPVNSLPGTNSLK